MTNEPDETDRLAVQPFQGVIAHGRLPELIALRATCLQPQSHCPLGRNDDLDTAPKGRIHREHSLPTARDERCTGCALLGVEPLDWRRLIDRLMQCRALHQCADHAAGLAHSSHVAAIIVTPDARVVDCDYRGESFLKAANVLHRVGGQLCCTEVSFQPNLNSALKEAASTGRTTNILLHAPEYPEKRFSLTLTRILKRPPAAPGDESATDQDVLCLVAPLDGRRIATARQLMGLFCLTRAEARLARALCHGNTVKEYARDQGLLLPTVRTQLSSVFRKTGTERQATLVRLIASIPVVRDSD